MMPVPVAVARNTSVAMGLEKIFDEDAWVEVDVIPLRPEGLSR